MMMLAMEALLRRPTPFVNLWEALNWIAAAGHCRVAEFQNDVSDTNVLVESPRPTPPAKVLNRMRSPPITGVPDGGYRAGAFCRPCCREADSARDCADVVRDARSGRPISEPDARIAAIARSRGAEVATRNAADFAGCELEVINPWL
jgi:hypothetical protein